MLKNLLLIFIFANIIIINTISLENYHQTPKGYIHYDCIHKFDEHFTIQQDGKIINDQGQIIGQDTPCPHKTIPINYEELLEQEQIQEQIQLQEKKQQLYYSGWVSFANYTHNEPIDFMTSTWVVPPTPPHFFILTKAIFLFNGVQDWAGNSTLILQPVLQYGFSGCAIGYSWKFVSFLVLGSGRAYCGKVLNVKEGDVLQGNMTLISNQNWNIQSQVLNKPKLPISSYTANIHADIRFVSVALEGSVIYHCQAYPGNTQTKFYDIKVTSKGKQIKPRWSKNVHYHECDQDCQIQDNETINIIYNSKKKSSILDGFLQQ